MIAMFSRVITGVIFFKFFNLNPFHDIHFFVSYIFFTLWSDVCIGFRGHKNWIEYREALEFFNDFREISPIKHFAMTNFGAPPPLKGRNQNVDVTKNVNNFTFLEGGGSDKSTNLLSHLSHRFFSKDLVSYW